MKLHIGQPPATPNFTPKEDGWTPLKEPGPLLLNLGATPIGLLAGILIALGWGPSSSHFEFGPSVFGTLAPLAYVGIGFGLGLPGLIIVHEVIHTLCYPSFGFTESTMIAVWPSKLLFLAVTFDALGRNCFLLVFLMPFLVIPSFLWSFAAAWGSSSVLLMLASTVNAMLAGGDVLGFFLILFQVPHNAIVRNQGWATWLKRVECA